MRILQFGEALIPDLEGFLAFSQFGQKPAVERGLKSGLGGIGGACALEGGEPGQEAAVRVEAGEEPGGDLEALAAAPALRILT